MTFCYECDILPTGQTSILFKKDSISVVANALDCSSSLIDASFKNLPAIIYDSVVPTTIIAASYTDIFMHTMQKDCKVSRCELMEPSCLIPLSP